MIDHQKLNMYVTRLQTCETSEYDSLFSDFYRELTSAWSSEGAIDSLVYKYRLEKEDVLSLANRMSFELIEKYKESEGNFYHFLSTSISRKLIDEAKKRNERANAQASSFETSMEDDPNMIPFIPHANAEEEAIEFLQKESEQQQLLAYLREKTDEKCRQAMSAFSKSTTYNGAAKLLGIDNETAKRRIRKVAKQFDSSIHGSFYDYFTVHTYSA
ncbi:hypothetical protein [Oceanobacillus neutriphilus]|uniref:Sigma-70 family RNA polymerase sigma factor n=1 Tax=Oceanobacillus neutriphilus TaxID=531815 RepID=A0ABQ2NY54_9BACI|nr:hypothetical protein [Oceanobacillus neutriphilus]GGP13478.1 hypothetical protein GCM10011346_33630 [Oceanobacillus neutriphilus]